MSLRWHATQLKAPLLATVFTLSSLMAYAVPGGTDSGGGAGCKDKDGRLKTLYYCGAYKGPSAAPIAPPPQPLSIDGPSETPREVSSLIDFIAKFHYLERTTREELIRAIKPSFKRKYFSTVAPPALTAPIVERIKEEFHHATGIDPKDLSLYAVTDTKAHVSNFPEAAQITYLLPGFSALPSAEQKMVALFHESLWVWQPSSDYKTIIAREMAFEAVMAQPKNTLRLLDFVQKMENGRMTTGYVSLAMKHDLETGALAGFASKQGDFSNLKFIGSKNIQCFNKAVEKSYAGYNIFDGRLVDLDLKDLTDLCLTSFENHIDGLRRTYPKSLFMSIAGSDTAKSYLERARVTVGEQASFSSGTVAVFNEFLCYIAGRSENSHECTGQDLNSFWDARGTVSLIFALERPFSRGRKLCPIDKLEVFRESQIFFRMVTDPSRAVNGALVPASPPSSLLPGPYKCQGEEKPTRSFPF